MNTTTHSTGSTSGQNEKATTPPTKQSIDTGKPATIYETEKDERNQAEVMQVVNYWLQNLPAVGGNGKGFYHTKIPTVRGEVDLDYSLWWNSLCVGKVEIKCHQMKEGKGLHHDLFLISRRKLLKMRWYNKHGFPSLLVYGSYTDGKLAAIHLADYRVLISERDRWEDAKDHHSGTTDHGKRKRKVEDKCYLIPSDMFWRVR